MISLLRRIRRSLIESLPAREGTPGRQGPSGSTRKYILYAIGEIALVVIGILIALQINNWNEANKADEQLIRIFEDIQKDLIEDVRTTAPALLAGVRNDSMINRVLNGKLTYEDYNDPTNYELFWVGLEGTWQFHIHESGFYKLQNHSSVIPKKYDSILSKINGYYLDVKPQYESWFEYAINQINLRHTHLSQNETWYSEFRQRKVTDEMINFYMSDPIYKNWVAVHRLDHLGSSGGILEEVNGKANKLILYLEELLNTSAHKDLFDFYYGPPIQNAAEYEGEYLNDSLNRTYKIEAVNNYLFTYDFYISSKLEADKFGSFNDLDFMLEFIRDNRGQITGVINKNDGKAYTLMKM